MKFTLLHLGGSAGDCAEGFISRERLVEGALLIGDFAYAYSQQSVIPDINFTTSGSVTKLTFAAQYRASATQYPELQVWRNMTGTFVKVGNTSNTEPIQTAYLNVYEYILDPPLPVLAGDVLGIYQPPEDESRFHLTFLEDTGPVNWYRDSATGPLDTFVIDTQPQRNMLPLVAVTFEPDGELNLLHTRLKEGYIACVTIAKSCVFSPHAYINTILCRDTRNHCYT